MNLGVLLCKFSILARDLELANIHTSVRWIKFDKTKLFTKTILSWNPKKLVNLIGAFSWFTADLKIWFICCSKLSLLSTFNPRCFTWDATLIFLEGILKNSFTWWCFHSSIIMTWNFPGFAIILFSKNHFKETSHWDSKDPINSWIVFLKQARLLSSVKL